MRRMRRMRRYFFFPKFHSFKKLIWIRKTILIQTHTTMPGTRHLTKKQLKAKQIAEKIISRDAALQVAPMPNSLFEIMKLRMVGFINKKKDWTETAEYKKDLKKKIKKLKPMIDCTGNADKLCFLNKDNEEFIIICKNLAFYYRLNLKDLNPCIIVTQNGKDETDYLQMFKNCVLQRWVQGNGKKGELGFFYNRGEGCCCGIDNEKDFKNIADEMCSQMPDGCNVYKHNHTINGEVFYGVGLANKNYSQDRFAMSIFRHMQLHGYTWYFHDEYDQQQLINRFVEHKNPPNYINCCSAPDKVSENDID